MRVSDFKIWIEGVMAFQNADWKPSAKQWNLIFQKIQELEDDGLHHQPVSHLDERQYHPQPQRVQIPYIPPQPLNHDPSLVPKLSDAPYQSSFE